MSPAIDVTYRKALLEPDTSHRVQTVGRRAGGKATNVVRVAHRLGCGAGDALTAAAVVAHVAGDFDAPTHDRLHPLVLVEQA